MIVYQGGELTRSTAAWVAHRPKFRLRKVVIGHGRIPAGSELSTLSRAWHEEIRPHCGEDWIGLLQRRFGYSLLQRQNYLQLLDKIQREWGGVITSFVDWH